MSSEGKLKKMRVLSAKITSQPADRARPLSGVSTQTYARKELIETVYTGHSASQINRAASAKTLTTRFASATMEGEKAVRKVVVKSSKKKEEMAEEIMNLKQTVNRLVEELSQQRGKTESMRKKNKKFSKILDIEFENEQHWSAAATHNHLVSGIRNMYDTLKESKALPIQSMTLSSPATKLFPNGRDSHEKPNLQYMLKSWRRRTRV